MTLEEAHAWLESKPPEAYYYSIEWLGTEWMAYKWFGPAQEDFQDKKGTFVECVEFVRDAELARHAQPQTAKEP